MYEYFVYICLYTHTYRITIIPSGFVKYWEILLDQACPPSNSAKDVELRSLDFLGIYVKV